MKIKIIAVGKVKEEFIKEGIDEYLKRIPKIDILEIRDLGKKLESQKMIEKLKKFNGVKILLDEHGIEMTSLEFSKLIKENLSKNICFVIGGPEGLDESIFEFGDLKLSLSKMTLTHEMARLFLIEQIYRAFTLIEGKKYHR
ncbi:MAG: 23S rRNA (pseudouridine(1915)-N(3))-methyltransferase RlmH [Candidatus Aenigmatarchaeota archaeon]